MSPDHTTYDDPIQGNQDNCALIAALSSVAWVTHRNKLKCTLDATTQKYKVNFYGPVVTPKVSNDLDPQNAHSYQNEVWVGLYEKAYAQQFCHVTNTDGTLVTCPDNPCPLPPSGYTSVIWPGNASPPLKYLTGCSTLVTVTSALSGEITYYCTDNKTRYPTVIWTRDTLPAGADPALRGRHAYSVLGYTGNHVILRDPFRVLPSTAPETNPNCLLTGTFEFGNNFRVSMCPGYLQTAGTAATKVTVTFGLNGIVGVHKDKIDDSTWFAGLSYVR